MSIVKTFILFALFNTFFLKAEESYYSFGKEIKLFKLPQTREETQKGVVYYKNQYGQKLGVKHEIIIKCTLPNNCQDVLQKYEILSIEPLTSTLLLLHLPKDADLFATAKALYKEPGIALAHPNFIKKRELR